MLGVTLNMNSVGWFQLTPTRRFKNVSCLSLYRCAEIWLFIMKEATHIQLKCKFLFVLKIACFLIQISLLIGGRQFWSWIVQSSQINVFLDKNFWKFVNIIAKLIILRNWEPKHATICCLSISVSVKVKEGGCTLGN